MQRIDIRINSTDWEKLKQDFQSNEYYPADIVFNGETVRNVGIRSRGLGSRSGTKPGLRVDMNRYTDDQTFLGLSAFILDNLTQDPSTVHETVAMKLFAQARASRRRARRTCGCTSTTSTPGCMPPSRRSTSSSSRASTDRSARTCRTTAVCSSSTTPTSGTFNYLGSDLEPYKTRFSRQTEENKPRSGELRSDRDDRPSRQRAAVRSQYLSVLGERLDLPQFMKYVAAQNFVAQNDGFLGYAGMNNFYFYRLENTLRHQFIAWDEDNAFAFPDFSLTERHNDNVLMRKAMEVPELRERVLQRAARRR